MKSEYHLFILWENSRHMESDIIRDITENFEIMYKINVAWSKKYFSDSLTRFYGVNLPENSGKEQHIGTGDFLVIVVRDNYAQYDYHETTKGKEYINAHTFLAKTKFRDLTGGGHKIHGTNTPDEFSHDFALLFGCSIEDFMNKNSLDSRDTVVYKNDLVGHAGWESLEQVFYILNLTEEYVVMRNYRPLPGKYYADEHGDIDFLVRDYNATRYTLNSQQVFAEKYRVHNKILVGNEEVLIDLRFVGDCYYDEEWQREILKSKSKYKSIYVMNSINHFYSLLYHVLIHKPVVGNDYIKTLNHLNSEIRSTSKIINRQWFEDGSAINHMAKHLADRQYAVKRPELSVYFNEDNVKKVNNCIENEKLIQKIVRKYKFDKVTMLHAGSKKNESQYYKATKGKETYFIKAGSFNHEHEYKITKLAHDKNHKFFSEPIGFHTGQVNYFVTKWVNGVSLDEFIGNNNLPKELKDSLVKNLRDIYSVLYEANIVHRDLIPRNFMVTDDHHLVLIDFYWAIKYDKYNEYDYIKKNLNHIYSLGENFAFDHYKWDDAYSFTKIAEYIYGEDLVFHPALERIRTSIGKRIITPSVSDFNSTINRLEKSNDELKESFDQLEKSNDELKESFARIMNSTSWKLTKTPRSISKNIKKLIKNFKIKQQPRSLD